jgi:hypothetical protein
MIEGKCPNCGLVVFGWALRFPRNQTCPKCGAALDITEDGKAVSGYSPFAAEKYSVNLPDSTRVPQTEEKPGDEQHK